MDLFLSICQGIGLALAAGALFGAAGREGAIGLVLAGAAAAAGATLFSLTLSADDYTAWPGVVAGALVAPLGFIGSRGIATGAATRAASGEGEAQGSPVAIAGTLALVALALAALTTLLPPISLIALGAFAWLAAQQRRRAQRKYEGLRVLR